MSITRKNLIDSDMIKLKLGEVGINEEYIELEEFSFFKGKGGMGGYAPHMC